MADRDLPSQQACQPSGPACGWGGPLSTWYDLSMLKYLPAPKYLLYQSTCSAIIKDTSLSQDQGLLKALTKAHT